MESQHPALGIIGAGKVGCTLARLLYAAGYAVQAVYSRSPDHARALARLVGAAALTGPLVRADVGTIAAHLGALASVDEDVAEVYRRLARLSLPMLAARGVPTGEIERVLGQDNHHAVNHP